MSQILKVRFTHLILCSGSNPSETKEAIASETMQIVLDDKGITLSWQERDAKDAHADISKNARCSTFIPMHCVLQIIYVPEPVKTNKYKK